MVSLNVDERRQLEDTTAYRMGQVDMSNGRGSSEWVWRLLTTILAGLVSYFTAMGALKEQVVKVETKQQAQFEEIQRSLSEIKQDIRDLRRGGVR